MQNNTWIALAFDGRQTDGAHGCQSYHYCKPQPSLSTTASTYLVNRTCSYHCHIFPNGDRSAPSKMVFHMGIELPLIWMRNNPNRTSSMVHWNQGEGLDTEMSVHFASCSSSMNSECQLFGFSKFLRYISKHHRFYKQSPTNW